MSGRTRVTLSDGRTVTGFRKTLRKNPRRPAMDEDLPFHLSFGLPSHIAGTLAPGPTGIIGVTVEPLSRICVEGHGLEWVCAQASEFLGKVAGKQNLELDFTISRGNYRAASTLIYVPGSSVIFPRSAKRALVFAVKGS